MPRRADLETILLIGSGPIVIGQACEFDYSGTQACRVLREEGFRVVLVNSNPATIMTDPEFADATYVEPLNVPSLERIIETRAPRRAAADARRPDRSQPRDRARRSGRARRVRRRDDRREHRGDPHRRGPPALQDRDDRDRPARAAVGRRVRGRRGAHDRGRGRLPGDRAARVHPRRRRHRHRARPPRDAARRRARPRREPDLGDPHRAQRGRVEGVRARGHARPRRQRGGHLLDRERRRDGRAHRRVDHRRARADAHRRRVPAHARRRRSRASAASASRPAARTCSSRSIRAPASRSSSR